MRSAKGSGHQPLRPSGPPPHEWGGATARQPGTLVLLRHGESTWNLENLFTGWTDVPLSERGVKEAVEAGRLMKEAGLRPGVVHESLLLRAIQTTQRALAEMDLSWILVKHLDRLSDAEVVELNIPTGVPRVYELDADLRPMAWRYLGDPAEVERRTAAVKAQGSKSSST